MAALTWRNIDAPNFSGVSDSYRLMGQLLNNGTASLDAALGDFQKSKTDANSSALGMEALRQTDPAAYNKWLQQVQSRGPINAETLNFLGNRENALLQNQGAGIANSQQREELGQTQWGNANTRGYEAARPAAIAAINEITGYASLGTPEGNAKAQELRQKHSDTFAAAGYKPEDVYRLVNENTQSAGANLSLQDNYVASGEAAKTRAKAQQADDLVNKALQTAPNVDEAAKLLRNDPNIKDSDVRVAALNKLGQQGETVYGPGANYEDVRIQERMLKEQAQKASTRAASGGGVLSPSANPLVGLADRTEGGADYSTLFGHSQRPGGAFEGVDVTKATIGQLDQFSNQYGPWVRDQLGKSGQQARIATPMGRFQIVNSTLQAAAKELGLSKDTVFDEKTQNLIFNHLVDKRLSGPRTMEGKMAGLRQEWEGFKKVSDKELASAITSYENGNRDILGGMTGRGGNSGSSPADLLAQSASQGQDQAETDPASDFENSYNQGTGTVNLAQSMIDQVTIDSQFNPLDSVVRSMVEPLKGKSMGTIIDELHKSIGDNDEGGAVAATGLTKPTLIEEVNRVRDKYKLAPERAAIFVENALKKNFNLFSKNTTEIDTNIVDRFVEEFIDPSTKKPRESKLKGAAAQINTMRGQEMITQKAQAAQQSITTAQQDYTNAQAAAQNGRPVNLESARLLYEARVKAAQKELDKLGKSPYLQAHTNPQTGR